MIYFATGSDPLLIEALQARSDLGIITTLGANAPGSYPRETLFIADNGCFAGSWTEQAWVRYIRRQAAERGRQTLWAVCPDVVGDHEATYRRWLRYSGWIRGRGLRPAFVLQNGCTDIEQVPKDARVLFIGGDDDYKLGPEAEKISLAFSEAGGWVHMGRVNSLKRTVYAASIGCASVDGTYVSFGPKINLPKVAAWLNRVHDPPLLWPH